MEIDLVCTNDVHYTFADDVEAHDILLCIQTGKKKADEDRTRYEGAVLPEITGRNVPAFQIRTSGNGEYTENRRQM